MTQPHQLALPIEARPSSPALANLWALRLLVRGGFASSLVNEDDYLEGRLAIALGLPDHIGSECRDKRHALNVLRQLLEQAEALGEDAHRLEPVLEDNLARLAAVVNLSALDRRLMALAVLLRVDPRLARLDDLMGCLRGGQLHDVLAIALNVDVCRIRQALAPQGELSSSGLLTVDSGPYNFRNKLDLPSPDFADALCLQPADPLFMLRDSLVRAPPSTLSLGDFDYLPNARHLVSLLRAARTHNAMGINALLVGPPGVGKTQLARAIATASGAECHQVAVNTSDSQPLGCSQRLAACRVAQRLLKGGGAILIFDEFEDILDIREAIGQDTSVVSKGALTAMLENNAVPTLYISNTVAGCDPALLRRFSLVIEMDMPPRQNRMSIIRTAVGGHLPEAAIRKLAQEPAASPGLIKTVADAARLVCESSPQPFERVFADIFMPAIRLQTARQVAGDAKDLIASDSVGYSCRYANADVDLDALANRLERHPHSRLLLWGVPGTGKSAYARHIAERIGAPLLAVNASDLLRPHVGESEQAIRQAFDRARADKAVLLIDEADSYLRSRETAQRSWEVTAVNEMLTNLEAFNSGVVIMTTNLMDLIDAAAMRRFDFKVKFRALTGDQSCDLLKTTCAVLGLPAPQEHSLSRLRRLHAVTPGDFAVVRRQHVLAPLVDADDLVSRLATECQCKPGGVKRPMGFV